MRTLRTLVCLLVVSGCFSLASAQPAPCSATDGKGIVACVAATYPEKLAITTTAQRVINMQFLRDRIIETARCAKFDVGLNLKRGGPAISNDFIAWRNGSRTEGVDIASGYDDATVPLKLQWHTYKAPDYGFPTYKAYGAVSCVVGPAPTPTPEPPTVDVNARVTALEQKLGDVNATVNALREMFLTFGQAFNSNAEVLQALVGEVNTEIENRKSQDDEHQRQLDVIKSTPIPTGCSVQFGLRCRLQ